MKKTPMTLAFGEGGIRTRGTITRTTVFEFYDSHVGLCRLVANRVLCKSVCNFGPTVDFSIHD